MTTTTKRQVYLPDDLWLAVKAQALLEGVPATDIVIRSLVDYLDRVSKPPEYVVNTEAGVTTVHYAKAPEPNTDGDIPLRAPNEAPAPLLGRIYDPHFGYSRPSPKPVKKAK